MSEPDATADGEAAAIPTSSDAGPDADGAPTRSARHPCRRPFRGGAASGPKLLAGFAVIVVVAALVAARTSVNYYVITPGDATPVSQYIEVPAADNHPLTGKILLTDVFVTQLNALNYLQYRFFDSDSEVISGPDCSVPRPTRASTSTRGTSRWPRPSPSPPRPRCPTSATRSRRPTRAR